MTGIDRAAGMAKRNYGSVAASGFVGLVSAGIRGVARAQAGHLARVAGRQKRPGWRFGSGLEKYL
jgi:hypothetical protein